MSKMQRTAFLFPGQGAYLPGALAELGGHPNVARHFAQIDAAVSEIDGDRTDCLALEAAPRDIDELLAHAPGALQTSIFGLSIAVFSMLEAGIGPSDVLVGHSLGEVAALTCAGAFSVADGARIVQARTHAAARTAAADGGMLALSADAETAAALVRAADDPAILVAAHNAPRQTVLSGTIAALVRVQAAAAALGIGCAMLKSPFAFHHQLLSTAVTPFRQSLVQVHQRPLQHRVYSPILGRFYRDDDDIPGLLAAHLVRPVHFMECIRMLHAQRFSHFVECGARDALTRLARHTVPDIKTIACLTSRGSASTAIEKAAGELGRQQTELRAAGAVDPAPGEAAPHSGPAPTLMPMPAPRLLPPPPPTPPAAERPSLPQLLADLRASYARALDYPESVFTEDADLEADLGVDSVKQAELLARVTDGYDLHTDPADFRLSELTTLGKISAFVLACMERNAAPAPATTAMAPAPAAGPTVSAAAAGPPEFAPAPAPRQRSRSQIFDELRATYAAALDYPASVFTETADLEADLGVDSVKQTELLAQVSDRYALALQPDDLHLSELTTLGNIADLVLTTDPMSVSK